MALELGYLKGGYVNFGFSILMLQDHCNLLYCPLQVGCQEGLGYGLHNCMD